MTFIYFTSSTKKHLVLDKKYQGLTFIDFTSSKKYDIYLFVQRQNKVLECFGQGVEKVRKHSLRSLLPLRAAGPQHVFLAFRGELQRRDAEVEVSLARGEFGRLLKNPVWKGIYETGTQGNRDLFQRESIEQTYSKLFLFRLKQMEVGQIQRWRGARLQRGASGLEGQRSFPQTGGTARWHLSHNQNPVLKWS